MNRRALSHLVTLAACSAMIACGDPPEAKVPAGSAADASKEIADAFHEEAMGDPQKAVAMYEHALDNAVRAGADPHALPAIEAAVEALASREVDGYADLTHDSSLAARTRLPILKDLMPIADHGRDPFARGSVARRIVTLAERAGDDKTAEKWRTAKGCAREAVIYAPVSWSAVTGVLEQDPIAAFDAPLPPSIRTKSTFSPDAPALTWRARGCAIDLGAVTSREGVREIVVDVDVPRAGTIGLSLRSQVTAMMRAGGAIVISRPYSDGGGAVARYATVDARAGQLRLVVRAGMETSPEHVEIDAWDDTGRPLAMHAPAAGSRANVAIAQSAVHVVPSVLDSKAPAERLTQALALLAEDAAPAAESLIADDAKKVDAPPDLALVYARALEETRDLSKVERAERERSALERVLDAWPGAWEAVAMHASLEGARRGESEAHIIAIGDAEDHAKKTGEKTRPMVDAFIAAEASRAHVRDRAKTAFDHAKAGLDGTSVAHALDRVVNDRTGAEAVAFECDPQATSDRDTFACYQARDAAGDIKDALAEIDRLRAIHGGADAYLWLTLDRALASGNRALASNSLSRMLPGENTLSALFETNAAKPADLLRAALDVKDSPRALAPLLLASGQDAQKQYEGIAERVTAEDRAHPIMADAATCVLAHDEKYEVLPSGLVHFVMLDVRRVSGTVDVDANAQASPPDIWGRQAMRVLRRRILKKDGRVLTPERAPNAAQAHADLAQLEAGDAIEAIYEGWGAPNETGDVGIDTPDLLPDRTAVHDATVTLSVPESLPASDVWAHPLLGKSAESHAGGNRVLTWKMSDHRVRRLEDGVPKMDRSVAVVLSTSTWASVASRLTESIAALDRDDADTRTFANDAIASIGAGASAKQKVDAIVTASGSAIKQSAGGTFFDFDLGRPSGPQSVTARTFITSREGSRSWLVVRALLDVGVVAEVAVAENDPFSADPAFPAHGGRFVHALVVAHTKPGSPADDVWIDADVPGPPLPAGRISPELRGRSALFASGSIVSLPDTSGDAERDEIDLRLTVDEKGDAKGLLSVLLRGRTAQELADSMDRVVGFEREKELRDVALAWVPFANVDSVALSSTEGSWQVAIRAEVSAFGYAQVEGAQAKTAVWTLPGIDPLHAVYPRPYVSTLGATYASQGARENALAISHAVQYHVHRKIDLPKGVHIVQLPSAFDAKTARLVASRKIGVSGTTIEEDFTLGISTGTVPQAEYGAFVTKAHDTDAAFLAGTRLKPPAP